VITQGNRLKIAEAMELVGSYFEYYGVEHEETPEGGVCPEDDTCECELVEKVNKGFNLLREVLSADKTEG
jgi:hypothetical protein